MRWHAHVADGSVGSCSHVSRIYYNYAAAADSIDETGAPARPDEPATILSRIASIMYIPLTLLNVELYL